jgi:uncharacterized protein (TIGR03083 family)
MTVRENYLLAADAFAALIDRLPGDGWDAPALGEWNLRDLVGHTTAAALTTVVAALDRPAEVEAIPSAEGYYAFARSVDPATYQAVAEAATKQARDDGAALGDQPAHAIRALLEEVATTLALVDDDTLVQIHPLVGGMRLAAWLPTRTFELAVHSIDIATATGVPADLPDAVVTDATVLAARIAIATGDAPAVLRALTGRAPLPENFSVLQPELR